LDIGHYWSLERVLEGTLWVNQNLEINLRRKREEQAGGYLLYASRCIRVKKSRVSYTLSLKMLVLNFSDAGLCSTIAVTACDDEKIRYNVSDHGRVTTFTNWQLGEGTPFEIVCGSLPRKENYETHLLP
jgi:hypothetical protein